MAEKRVENGCYFFTFRILCPPCWNVFLWERQSVFQRFVVRIQVSNLATCCFLSQDFSLQVLLRNQGLGWFKLIKSGQHPRPPFIKSKFGQMFSMFNFLSLLCLCPRQRTDVWSNFRPFRPQIYRLFLTIWAISSTRVIRPWYHLVSRLFGVLQGRIKPWLIETKGSTDFVDYIRSDLTPLTPISWAMCLSMSHVGGSTRFYWCAIMPKWKITEAEVSAGLAPSLGHREHSFIPTG